MTWLALTGGLFLLLLLFPILLASFWYFHSKDSVLPVRQNRSRDPRYFAKSFDKLFQEAWPNRDGEMIALSRPKPEPYYRADDMDLEDYPSPCSRLVVAEQAELAPPGGIRFQREIYAWRDARFSEGSWLRAVRAKGNLLLDDHVYLDRWADADGTVAVYDDCNLGISLTSATAITLGKNCRFRRLFAPVIHLGGYPGQGLAPRYPRDPELYQMNLSKARRRLNGRVSYSDTEDTGILPASVVSGGKLVIEERLVIQGSVRSHKSVHLSEWAVICGNLFADGDIFLDSNSTVLGNVFSQGNIYCERGVVIGREGRVSSVIARGQIVMERDCFVYGYISNETGGLVWPEEKQDDIPSEEPPLGHVYLAPPAVCQVLTFPDRETFERVDDQGFRHNPHIREVLVPAGVRAIPESMFFHCTALEAADLPPSLEEIGDYAFADCTSLRRVDLSRLTCLRRIGRSAFDGCTALEAVVLPPNLEHLGATAFCGCTALGQVELLCTQSLKEAGAHCFQRCPAADTLPDLGAICAENRQREHSDAPPSTTSDHTHAEQEAAHGP